MDKVLGGQSYQAQAPCGGILSSAFAMHSQKVLSFEKEAALGV